MILNEYYTLANGSVIPKLGLGTWFIEDSKVPDAVKQAVQIGYRHIDTAQAYENEEQVGNAIAKSGVSREEIFLTTKVWIEHYGYEQAKKSVRETMEKLQTSYLDLILLHQPFSDYYGAYRALEELYEEGKVRAIGVSNFYPDRLVDIASFAKIKPMVNQVETHPFNQQRLAKEYMDKYQIQIEAWAPFGEGRGGLFENSVLSAIGEKYGKTTAQVMLRWHCDEVSVVIAATADGSPTTQTLFMAREGLSDETPVRFDLQSAEVKDGGSVWLRYKVHSEEGV